MIKRIFILCFFVSLAQAQEKKTVFGLQYKPIVPAAYFDAANISAEWDNFQFDLSPRYSYSFGMVVRRGLNRTFSFETGINYIDRNYRMSTDNSTINLDDFTDFSLRAYEIP